MMKYSDSIKTKTKQNKKQKTVPSDSDYYPGLDTTSILQFQGGASALCPGPGPRHPGSELGGQLCQQSWTPLCLTPLRTLPPAQNGTCSVPDQSPIPGLAQLSIDK